MSTNYEEKHTPGPWGYHRSYELNTRQDIEADETSSGFTSYKNIISSGDKIICEVTTYIGENVGWPRTTKDENAANADLIIAAPELLEALQMLLPQEPNDCDSYDKAMWQQAKGAIAKATGKGDE